MDTHAQAGDYGDPILDTIKECLTADLEQMRIRRHMIADLVASQPDLLALSEQFKGALSIPKAVDTTSALSFSRQRRTLNRFMDSNAIPDKFAKLFTELDDLQAGVSAITLQYRTALAAIRERDHLRQHDRSFPSFMGLPPELRSTIWELTLHTRVHHVSRTDCHIPAIAHTCRDSRATFLRLCPNLQALIANKPSSLTNPCSSLFYTPSTSAIFLPSRSPAEYSQPVNREWFFPNQHAELIIQAPWTAMDLLSLPLNELLSRPRSGAITHGFYYERNDPLEWKSYHFSHLSPSSYINKTINIHPGRKSYIDNSTGRPDLVRDLFQGNDALIIDLQDMREVTRVAQIMRQFLHEWDSSANTHPDRFLNTIILSIDQEETHWDSWNTIRQGILERLASITANVWLPWIGRSGSRKERKSIAREMLANTKVRLVHVMELQGKHPREFEL